MTHDEAWNYYIGIDQKEAKVLENKVDELNMAFLYVRNCNIPKMLEMLLTQFGLGIDNFPRTLEQCCSIHTTTFKQGTKEPNGGSNDDNATNNEDRTNNSLIGAHLTMDSAPLILAAHASNNTLWEITDNNNIGLLVGKEDMAC